MAGCMARCTRDLDGHARKRICTDSAVLEDQCSRGEHSGRHVDLPWVWPNWLHSLCLEGANLLTGRGRCEKVGAVTGGF